MDWHIRVIEGPDKGLEQLLQPGPNIIGRGKAAAVRLTVEDVSWEHAAIIREQEHCFLENLSALGTWVGDGRVNSRVRLRDGDRIRLSEETILRVDCVGAGGISKGLLLTGLLVMLVLLSLVFYYQVLMKPETSEHWEVIYHKLDPWLSTEVAHRQMPPEALTLFHEAWRHSAALDWPASQKAWMRLQIVLGSPQAKIRCMEEAQSELGLQEPKQSLHLIGSPPPEFTPTDDNYAAALGTFVNRWLLYSIKKQESMMNTYKPS